MPNATRRNSSTIPTVSALPGLITWLRVNNGPSRTRPTQKKSSQPPTPCKSARIGRDDGAAAGPGAKAGAAAVRTEGDGGGTLIVASRPHNGQISEASAICCPHLAQNIEVLAKPLKPSLIAVGLAFFARLLNEIGQLPRALLLQQLFHGSRNDWVGAQDALVGSQSAFHAGRVLGDAVVLFVGMLDEKHDIAEQHLIHELGSVAVARGNQIETKHGGTGRDVDVRNVLDPLQGPFLFGIEALVERVLFQLARQIHEALALLRSRRGTLGFVLRGVLARQGTRRHKQHGQQEKWKPFFHKYSNCVGRSQAHKLYHKAKLRSG